MSSKEKGDEGENLACALLIEKGYKIIERNYRYGHGEIDIVAMDGDVLVFTEVKTRHNLNFGHPLHSISLSKRKQLYKIASAYLFENDIEDRQCRFDFIGVLLIKGEKPEITHLENAFSF